jgi:hypothetical protein
MRHVLVELSFKVHRGFEFENCLLSLALFPHWRGEGVGGGVKLPFGFRI